MLVYILFIIGFVLLITGASWLLDGSVSLAHKMKVSNIVIGLTVVAFGTSSPELIVNVLAAATDNSGLAIGNIIGSNIANILLILGVSAIIAPLMVLRNTVRKEIPFSLFAALLLAITANDLLINRDGKNVISLEDGIIYLLFFAVFMYYTFSIARKRDFEKEEQIREYSNLKSIGLILLGLAGLFFGGKWIVDGAGVIATKLGLSHTFIGLTIVAIGTSLPELATGVVAVYKGKTDIAIGNVVGSNIFNVFWVLGLTSVIKPIPFDAKDNFSLGVNVLASILLFAFLFVGKRNQIGRIEGIAFTVLYFAYLAYLVVDVM